MNESPMPSQDAQHAVQDALKRRWLDGEFLATHLNEATSLDMRSMKWGDAEMTKLAAALEYCHARGALAQLTTLYLQGNQIGDAGCTTLAEACGRGPLAQLTRLLLDEAKIGDAGCTALAEACGRGALAKLTMLGLGRNQIADPGCTALAKACGRGALAQLKQIWQMKHRHQLALS